MSETALTALESAQKLFLRTGRHPAADELAVRGLSFETFDHLYEASSSFDEVYRLIAESLVREAEDGDVTYAVPGHPLVAERSVIYVIELAKDRYISVRFAGSSSFIEACLEALAMPVGKGLKLIDALNLDNVRPATDCPNLVYQVFDRMVASSVKLMLMDVYPDEFEVYVISGAGGSEARVDKLPLFELDRREFNHLSSVYIPELEGN